MVDALYSECGSVVVGGRGVQYIVRDRSLLVDEGQGSRGGMVRALDTMLWMDLWYYILCDRSLLVDEGQGVW